MTGHIGPLVQRSTPSIIADKLRAAIGYGELKPGEQLLEADLARQLGVSRGPLREGMQRLTQEGLLVAIRNRGLFVIDMTPEDIRDMYIAREAIERGAGELLVNSIDADGTKEGFDLELVSLMREISSVPVIASGGAGAVEHFAPAVRAGADAVLAASVFHSGQCSVGEVKRAMRADGIDVRDSRLATGEDA